MKKTLKLALACTLGAAFVFVGCTKDYSSDISKLDTRVSAIEKEDVASRLKNLEDADATFKTQLQSIDEAISLTNKTIENMQGYVDGELAAIKTKLNLCATKEELTNAVADIYKNVYKKNETYSKEQIDALLNLDLEVEEGKFEHFDSVQDMLMYVANICFSNDQYLLRMINSLTQAMNKADGILAGRLDALEAWKVTAQAAIDKNAEDISTEAARAKAAEEQLKQDISAVAARVSTIESNLGDFTNAEYNQYKEKMKETVEDLQDQINKLAERMQMAEDDIKGLASRINSIAAKAPVGDNNVEARQFLFGDIDKTKIIMTFNITPGTAANNITAANSRLVVTEGQTRTDLTKAVTDDCKEYEFYGAPFVIGKAVKVAAFVQSKLNKENRYWASLKYYGEDAAGKYAIASAPVEVIEGECIDLTNPANLVWYNKNDEKVEVVDFGAPADQPYTEYQAYADEESAPTLVTALNEVCYKTVYLKGEVNEAKNVFDGYYLKVKTEKGDKKLSELKVDFDLTDAQIAITAGEGVQKVCDPANKYWGEYEGTQLIPADPELFTYITTSKLGELDVKVAYPDKYYEGLQTVAARWLAVGTSSKYTIPAIKIGAVSYPGLAAIHRTYFAGHTEENFTKITEFVPFVEWDYINYAKTSAIPGNGFSNGSFYGYDLVGDANMQIIRMFTNTGAAAPFGDVTYNFLDSSRRVDLFIDNVTVTDKDQPLKAQWEKKDVDLCEPTGVKVNTYKYNTELPFTVEARHADVTSNYAPAEFIPLQGTKDNKIQLTGGIINNKFTDDAANWLGSLKGKTIADVKAAYKAAIAAAPVDLTVSPAVAKTNFALNTATGELTIKAGALDYNMTYTLTYKWTVFGVTFKDVITLKTIAPKYSIKTRDLYVDPTTKTVTIEGQLVDYTDDFIFQFLTENPQAYVIKDAHMNKYVFVENYDVVPGANGTGETLSVEFERDQTKVAFHNGKTSGLELNEGDGVLDTDIYTCWNKALWPTLRDFAGHGAYKGESTKVTATLKANGRFVNKVEFTIKRIDPIKVAASYEIDVNKVSAKKVTVNALKNLSVIGTLPFDMTEKTTDLWDNTKFCWKYTSPHYNYGQGNTYYPHRVEPKNISIKWDELSCKQALLYEGIDYEVEGNEITIIQDNAGVAYTIEVPVEITLNYGETPYKTTAKINVKQGQ